MSEKQHSRTSRADRGFLPAESTFAPLASHIVIIVVGEQGRENEG